MVRQLQRHEGTGPILRERGRMGVYRCPAGRRTVGYGRNLDAHPLSREEARATGWDGASITLAGGEWLLRREVDALAAALAERWPWWPDLDPVRQDVLINMAYNLGAEGLSRFYRTLRYVERRLYVLAATQMLASHWAHQVGSRANELARQMRTGEYER